MLKKVLSCTMLALLAAALLTGAAWAEEKFIKMSTTTSTENSGLLDVLLPAFLKDTGIKVRVVAKGTGAAIMDGQDGNVDIIFVHSRVREVAFVAEGFGTRRYTVMFETLKISATSLTVSSLLLNLSPKINPPTLSRNFEASKPTILHFPGQYKSSPTSSTNFSIILNFQQSLKNYISSIF